MHFSEMKTTLRRNLGNYEHVESTLTLVLEETDCIDEAAIEMEGALKRCVGKSDIIVAREPLSSAAPAVTKEAVEKMAEETPAKVPAKKAPVKKAPAKKAPVKKAPAKKAEVVPTMEEMMVLCRETATRLKSGEKVKALIEKACGVASLKEADEKTFLALQKLLKAAK